MTPPPTFNHAIRIAADALPRAEFRSALIALIHTDPEVRRAIRTTIAPWER